MALQHLRSSTADKRPTPAVMSDGQLAMNTNLASPGLFLKDSNGDLVKVGPVHVGTTAPNATPGAGGQAGNSKGEQWLDTSSSRYVFKIWDGTAWRTEDGEFVNISGDTMTGALGIIAGTAAAPGLFFSGDPNTGLYSPGADQLAVATNGVERVEFGTSEVVFNDGGANYDFRIEGDTEANLLFVDASTDRVGIGTSSPTEVLDVNGQAIFRGIVFSNPSSTTAGFYGPDEVIQFANNTEFQLIRTRNGAGIWGFKGGNNNEGSLIFKTHSTQDTPTERMRIGSDGLITSTVASASQGNFILNATSSSYISNQLSINNFTAAGTAFNFLQCWSSNFTSERFKIIGNGNVENVNNSYGAISDIKLKENIIDANSQWNDLKALRVRKYNFKEGETHTQIGLVAQEVELVSPGLVNESIDRNAEGDDLGTVTKSVNYSVLYMKAVKALQEAMERIETLEARLTAAGIA